MTGRGMVNTIFQRESIQKWAILTNDTFHPSVSHLHLNPQLVVNGPWVPWTCWPLR
jgi:hypothetical protein